MTIWMLRCVNWMFTLVLFIDSANIYIIHFYSTYMYEKWMDVTIRRFNVTVQKSNSLSTKLLAFFHSIWISFQDDQYSMDIITRVCSPNTHTHVMMSTGWNRTKLECEKDISLSARYAKCTMQYLLETWEREKSSCIYWFYSMIIAFLSHF